MNQVAIFIDLDNTLVETEIDHECRKTGDKWLHFQSTKGDAMYRSTLRPFAEEFLQKLGQQYPLYLLTAGMREFQIQVLDYHGITKYFTAVFGREDISDAINRGFGGAKDSGLVPGISPVLVDDLPPGSDGFVRKFAALGIDSDLNRFNISYEKKLAAEEMLVKKYYIEVAYFTRKDRKTDRELIRVYPEILVKAESLK